jgi:Putative GTPase activating protein for Arf
MASTLASTATETTAASISNGTTQSVAVATATTVALTEMDPEDWKIISKLPGNNNCIDCNAKYPEWGSVSFGILFCTRCCSGHR